MENTQEQEVEALARHAEMERTREEEKKARCRQRLEDLVQSQPNDFAD